MPTLPTDRDTADTAADHVTDHNTLHTLNNQLGTFTQATTAPVSPAAGDLWLDTDEVVAQSGTSGQGLVDFASATRTTGDVQFTTTSYVNFATTTDLVLTAAVGDVLEIGAMGLWDNRPGHSHLGPFSVVAGSPVNGLWPGAAAGTSSAAGWGGLPVSNFARFGGSFLYTVVAGDLSGGTITLRLRGKLQATSDRAVFANTIDAFHWWAKNLGPAL